MYAVFKSVRGIARIHFDLMSTGQTVREALMRAGLDTQKAMFATRLLALEALQEENEPSWTFVEQL